MANLEDTLVPVMERNVELEEKNAQLREEVADLKQQLAAARKNSSTFSRPPSNDILQPKKPLPEGGQKRNKGAQPGQTHS